MSDTPETFDPVADTLHFYHRLVAGDKLYYPPTDALYIFGGTTWWKTKPEQEEDDEDE
jgi:hypothetical protein